MDSKPPFCFWAKTLPDGTPGISVRDHCVNVGVVAEALIAALPYRVRSLLPPGSATLTALHDVGKISLGFLTKCPAWLHSVALPPCPPGHIALSVTDHAFVSQAFLQKHPDLASGKLWAVAVGAHHGRPKGRDVRLNSGAHLEALTDWADAHRRQLLEELKSTFGPLPTTPPSKALADLWLLAGLITVADWIGSNEVWFSPAGGLAVEAARARALEALREIDWPGGKLRSTSFSEAFGSATTAAFIPNKVQDAVAAAALQPCVIVVEAPMGCGKTEAALFAAQQLIAAGHQQGIYFALPTQVTSNRIHRRVESFLQNTLADAAPLRLAHGNAWLEDDFILRLNPSFVAVGNNDGDNPVKGVQEARSWFASAKQALLATYGVGTIDQALQAVVAVKHFFVRRFALAGKVVILDEIHSYDLYTGTLISALIRELVSLHCSVIVLSATLTAGRRRELLTAAGIQETEENFAYPLISSGTPGNSLLSVIAPKWPSRRPIKLRVALITEAEVVDELISRAEAGQHVLWIRNTVVEAQESFRTVSGCMREGTLRVGLLHSRFPFHRRSELEDVWLELLGRHRPTDGPGSILIATQVVEQSVDIDLDFIVSDLAPTDMLLQRVGRLWRHERSHRNATAPEFWVRLPDLGPSDDAKSLARRLGRSARVYAPYVLVRTSAVWEAKAELCIPADIRPLLEATYADPGENEPQAWRDLHQELKAERQELADKAEAATRVLGNPMLMDQEEVLTRRKGTPTTHVVLIRSAITGPNGCVIVVALDGTTHEISGLEWRRSTARLLHHWIVRVPRWMVPAHAPSPRWLMLHGPSGATVATVGYDGCCAFDGEPSPMIYNEQFGLFIERPTKFTPQSNNPEDESDF